MPDAPDTPTEGAVHTFERTITEADVRRFADLSGDRQPRHLDPDEEGRLMAHGLLTATLPTKIGGDIECLAREMHFEFLRPVYAGETVTCEWTTETVEERADRWDLTATVVCRIGDDPVLRGDVDGLVWK